MAELDWTETTPLSRIYATGRHGVMDGAAGLSMTEMTRFGLVQVMARRGRWDAVAAACVEAYGKDAPARPQAVEANGALLIWSGPDQFLVLSARDSAMQRAREAFAGVASLSEQSDGRCLIRISGRKARDMLAKVCSLDLHTEVFPAGAAAATSVDHTPVNLWRGHDVDREPAFHLLVFATFAESLWRTLLDSGAEYGVAIDAPTNAPGAWQP